MSSFTQNRRLGRGVNIIGYDPLWDSPEIARMRDHHFHRIAEAGFDSVRINLHAFRHMGPEPEYELSPGWRETLNWAVSQALSCGLSVVLDLHEFEAMGKAPLENRERFVAFWEQIAEQYSGAPDSVFFEILNEPFGELTPALWNTYLAEALRLIRVQHPTRAVIVGPGHWNGITHLAELQLPQDDRDLIVTVHYYSPMQFTHQGAAWSQFKDLSGIVWAGTAAEKAAIEADFAAAQRWAAQERRPLYLGEFGAYDQADMASRARYTAFVARQAELLGWSWAYWQFDSDFVVYDIPNERWVEPIRDALIPRG